MVIGVTVMSVVSLVRLRMCMVSVMSIVVVLILMCMVRKLPNKTKKNLVLVYGECDEYSCCFDFDVYVKEAS